MSSQKSTGERAKVIQEYREADSALITNARCLQEGVDIPAVDCVLFADPKQSVVDIVQAAGRAMRPFPGKKYGYIVIPIIVPSGMEFDTFAETTEFRQIARVVTALSTQDSRIAEEFRVAERGKRRNGRIVEISGDVPVGYKIDFTELQEQIRLKLWERVGRANWRDYAEARNFVRGLGLTNKKAYAKWAQGSLPALPPKPFDIPATPESTYAGKGWKVWGDWLGTSRRRGHWRSFEDARAFVRSLNLSGGTEWRDYCAGRLRQTKGEKPIDIPSNANTAYKGSGYVSWGDWFGTENLAPGAKQFRSFADARLFARSLHLRGLQGWRDFCKSGRLPIDIPASPHQVYSGQGWISYGDFLGTKMVATRHRQYLSFDEARRFVHKLGIKDQKEWRAYCKSGKLRSDIPAHADRTYANNGWIGYGDWLGTGSVAPKNRAWREFAEARVFARSLALRTWKEWLTYVAKAKLPSDIPKSPQIAYRSKGWHGWGDWLGTGRVSTRLVKYRTFVEARDFARSLVFTSNKQWREFCKSGQLPADIPASPNQVYAKNGWLGYSDWLGHTRRGGNWRPFNEARKFVQALGLSGDKEWRQYLRGDLSATKGARPMDIPTNPEKVYRDDGFVSLGDWLGTGRSRGHWRSFEEARKFVRSLGCVLN